MAFVALLLPASAAACSSDSPSPTPVLTATPAASATLAPTKAPESPTVTATPTLASATATPTSPPTTPTPRPAQEEPLGFPIDPSTRLGVVVGEVGSRTMDWEGGLTAEAYSRDLQPSANADAANSMGWDCRVHVEYEGQPAVDWYIPVGTPVRSTLDGRATMYVVSLPNAFDYYDVSREPYIGNPDRDRAPLSPFPGPGGGKGVFIEVTNDAFATEYGHLNLEMTLPADDIAAAYTNRGLALAKKGNVDAAIADYTKAIAIDPNLAWAYYSRGEAYIQKGDVDRGIADYGKAIAIDPKNFLAYNNRGAAYYYKGEVDRAISDFTKVIAIEPNYAAAYHNRAAGYYRKRELAHAIADFAKAIEINPKDAAAYNGRSVAYLYKGDFGRAIADSRKAEQLQSADAQGSH